MNKLDIISKKYGGSVRTFHRGRVLEYTDEDGNVRPRFKDEPKFDTHTGGDASERGYTDVYLKEFDSYKDDYINFLEIGIFQGRSLAMWSDYFSKGTVFGIDLNLTEFNLMKPELEKMGAFSNKNLAYVAEMNSTNAIATSLCTCFNIIIDDGDHTQDAQWWTFKNFYPNLCSGGIYIIEDCRCFWADEFKKIVLKTRDDDKERMTIFSNIKSVEIIECKDISTVSPLHRLVIIKKL